MKWVRFTDKKPPLVKRVLVKYKTGELYLAIFKRPFDANSEKYNENYYQMRVIENEHEWIDYTSASEVFTEWLDLSEDGNHKK